MFIPTEKQPVYVSIFGYGYDGTFEAQLVFVRKGDEIHCASKDPETDDTLTGKYSLIAYTELMGELSESFDITFHCPYYGERLNYH